MERIAIGRHGEDLACEALEQAGYRLLERNARCGRGEVDVVAWDNSTLCFVEVRTRESTEHGHPLETVDRPKQSRLIASAHCYMEKWAGPWPDLRFDVVGVVLDEGPSTTIVKEAFEA